MIVRQFINWIRTAPAGERAEATRALARAWLISDLSHDDRVAARGGPRSPAPARAGVTPSPPRTERRWGGGTISPPQRAPRWWQSSPRRWRNLSWRGTG